MKVDIKWWWAIPVVLILLFGISLLIPGVRNGVVEVLVSSVNDSKAMVSDDVVEIEDSEVITDTDTVDNVPATESVLTGVQNVSSVKDQVRVKKDNMTIHVLNSSGTAVLVVSDGEGLLLDGSDGKDAKKIADYIRSQGVYDLKYLVATNYHSKSLEGVSKILSYISSDYILVSKNVATDKLGVKLRSYLSSKSLTWNQVSQKIDLTLGSISFELIPSHDGGGSLVTVITNGESKFVFTGDITGVDKGLLKQLPTDVDMYMVSSRMVNYVLPQEVLERVKPKNVVLGSTSGGKANDKTLSTLKETGSTVYNTSQGGSVIISSNGADSSFSTKKF